MRYVGPKLRKNRGSTAIFPKVRQNSNKSCDEGFRKCLPEISNDKIKNKSTDKHVIRNYTDLACSCLRTLCRVGRTWPRLAAVIRTKKDNLRDNIKET